MALVEQPHGGALQVGNPGNKGGPGRPDLAVRERCRASFQGLIPILEGIGHGTLKQRIRIGRGKTAKTATADPEFSDRIAAIDKLGKYGLPPAAAQIAAAQFETPEGYTFSLVIGERHVDDAT